jgi:hypothetical protein
MRMNLEKGEIVEIGSSEFNKDVAVYSHIMLRDEDGKTVKITNVSVDSNVMPKIEIGNEGYFAIVGRAAGPMGLGPRRNGIIAFGNEAGIALAKEPRLQALIILGPVVFVLAAIMVIGVASGYSAMLFMLVFLIPFMMEVRSIFEGRAAISEARQKLLATGAADTPAVKVY